MADRLPGGGRMPQQKIMDPGGQVRNPLGPDAPVSPRPGAPAATPSWPYGAETQPAPVLDNRPVRGPGG